MQPATMTENGAKAGEKGDAGKSDFRDPKESNPTMVSFTPTQILPEPFPRLDSRMFGDPSAAPEPIPPSDISPDGHALYSGAHDGQEHESPTQAASLPPEERSGFDLKPPPPNVTQSNAELLSERLFSTDHLNLILRHHTSFNRFKAFLSQYRPSLVPILMQYLETQKAVAAVEYANAIAERIWNNKRYSNSPTRAARSSSTFEARSRRAVDDLLYDGLPAYITYRLTQIVTECLVKELTGNNPPIMRELVQGLAEVYCMSDPSLPDCPIVYASDEFYKTTQYGRDYVIGRNCRFLQGPKTAPAMIARLAEAMQKGEEVCETILNYRRDGTPFLNLVVIHPLYDNKGAVRYFLGCQIDVTYLIEGGKGLESFQHLLNEDQAATHHGETAKRGPLKALGNLAQLLGTEEIEVLQQRARHIPRPISPTIPTTPRRFVGMEDPTEMNIWPPSAFQNSGRPLGVYQNFLLVRPYPSLRITFTSSALRIPGLAQSCLLDRISGPQNVFEGIQASLIDGVPFTAKVFWIPSTNIVPGNTEQSNTAESKPRWIHCTPLRGSDEKIGVWMVVMVEQEEVTGSLNAHSPRYVYRIAVPHSRFADQREEVRPDSRQRMGAASRRFTEDKLFAEYQRREGKEPATPATPTMPPTPRNMYAEYLREEGGSPQVRSGTSSGAVSPRRTGLLKAGKFKEGL